VPRSFAALFDLGPKGNTFQSSAFAARRAIAVFAQAGPLTNVNGQPIFGALRWLHWPWRPRRWHSQPAAAQRPFRRPLATAFTKHAALRRPTPPAKFSVKCLHLEASPKK